MNNTDQFHQKIKEAGELFCAGFKTRGIQDRKMNITNFLLMLWQKKILLISIILVAVGIVFVGLNFVPMRYTASALVMIKAQENSLNNMAIHSEVEVLKSRTLARKVIYGLELMKDVDFNSNLKSQKIDRVVRIFKGKNLSPSQKIDRDVNIVIENFIKNVQVTPVSEGAVLKVKFTSSDSNKAALVANAIASSYVEQRTAQSLQTLQKLSEWLDAQYERLRKKVQLSREEIATYQLENDESNEIQNNVQNKSQRLNKLKASLAIAKLKLVKIEARLGQNQTNQGVLSSAFKKLKQKEKTLLNHISKMSVSYGDKHPEMMKARKQLNNVRYKIRKEGKRSAPVISKNDVLSAKTQVKNLVREISIIEKQEPTIPPVQGEGNSPDFQELVQAFEDNKIILNTFLQSYKPMNNLGSVQKSGAYILAQARPPLHGSYPNKPFILILTILGSFLCGVILILLLKKLDYAYKTALQLENETGYPCFGVIGASGTRDETRPIADYVLQKSAMNIAESVRALRMVINLRKKKSDDPAGDTSTVVAITSALPNEGKTTLSAWLGRVAAKAGERVIVVDCDLRRPRLHEAYGNTPHNTLVEYLTGRAKLEELIFRDPVSKGHAIFARSVPNNAMDLIGKARMKNLINALRKQYDLIILDSPACLAVPEARLLSSYADQTLFAVSWDETPREVVNAGVKQFADIQADALAFVLTNVDTKQHLKYSCGDAVYYYGRYEQPYSD